MIAEIRVKKILESSFYQLSPLFLNNPFNQTQWVSHYRYPVQYLNYIMFVEELEDVDQLKHQINRIVNQNTTFKLQNKIAAIGDVYSGKTLISQMYCKKSDSIYLNPNLVFDFFFNNKVQMKPKSATLDFFFEL